MVIHTPELREHADGITVTAAVETERQGTDLPKTLWFAFPTSVAGFVSDRADAFAVALLPLAMHLGEPMTVHGELSYRLARGLREY